MIKVSVIVPIYGVEDFIEQCAESLMRQTLQEVEYLFINDATKDNSIIKLESTLSHYRNRRDQVKIINHTENRGLPSARNTGLSLAEGEYIFHCDGDDFLEPSALEILYNTAKEKDADIVWCDFFLSFQNSEKYMHQPDYKTPHDALLGMMSGKMKYNVWNKLVKRTLYEENKISFPAGYSMGEDMTMMMLFVHAKRVAYIDSALYHYVQWNTNALTFGGDCIRHLDILEYNTKRVADYINEHSNSDMRVGTASLKLNTKWPFLLDGKRSSFNRWKSWFIDSNAYIWQIPEISFRMKFIEWAASKGQFWIVWLHYVIVIRFYYGVVYR